MRYATVCSGIEAPSLAWHPLGWRPVFFSEIDPFPCALLAHRYPAVPNHGDMTSFQEWPDATFDVLAGGTSCQSFSIAGLRKGMADARGGLSLTFLAIAARYRPRWVVWENVPGVLSQDQGRAFGSFLGGLADIGYGWAYRVLDAQYFGLAQRRKRVFVVGCADGWAGAAAVLFDGASMRGDPAPGREAREDVARPIASSSKRGSGYRNDADTAENLTIVPPLKARDYKGVGSDEGNNWPLIPTTGEGFDVAHTLKAEGFDAGEDGTGRGVPLVPVAGTLGSNHGNIKAEQAWTGQLVTAFAENGRAEVRLEGGDGQCAGTLSTGGGKAGQGCPMIAFHARQDPDSGPVTHPLDTDGSSIGVQVRAGVRRLTPRECERLQGMPDDYTLVPYRGKPAKDSPRYKAIGNSMAVPVVRWIGERIEMANANPEYVELHEMRRTTVGMPW